MPQTAASFRRRRMRRQAHGQDHHIELFQLDVAVFVHKSEFQVMGAGIFRHPGDHGADEAHPVFVPGPFVVAVKTLALGPEIDEEDGGRHPMVVFFGDDGLLGGVHAAHVGAVFPADGGVPGAHALNPGDSFGLGLVAGASDVAGARPGGR